MKLKDILFETPDRVIVQGVPRAGSTSTRPNFAFGYYKNKLYVGEEGAWHSSINISGEYVNRDDMKFAGRLWPRLCMISFWEFPDANELKKIIKQLNLHFAKKKLDIKVDNYWLIDTISINTGKENIITIDDYLNKNLSPKTRMNIKKWNDWDEPYD